MDLESLGWDSFFGDAFACFAGDGLVPARVVEEHKELYQIRGAGSGGAAEVSGKLRHGACGPGDFPAVGDWVVVSGEPAGGGRAVIQAVLPRKSSFSRKVAGERTDEQVVAANIDTAFLVTGLDGDFNPRRIERYLAAAWESGADPVIVLNKADLHPDLAGLHDEVESIARGVPVHVVSALAGDGLGAFEAYLRPGHTIALLGSSGVGKSTLINGLMGGGVQRVQAVRPGDDRGRHTTTHRQLFVLDGGGLLVDTPGMRELQLWEGDGGIGAAFGDVEELAEGCRYRDCSHQGEPGCAVKAAVETGELPAERLANYLKLGREMEYLEGRQDKAAQLRQKQRFKAMHRAIRQLGKGKG